jgi:hypothetical protein
MAPRKRKRTSDLETNVAPDALPDDLRRDERQDAPPDSMPPRDLRREGAKPAGGGFTPSEDGGNPQHPVHDEDQEDKGSGAYEREINRLDAAVRSR